MDLVRSVRKSQRPRVGEGRREREVLAQTAGPVQLNGIVDNFLDELRRRVLDRLDLTSSGLRPALIYEPGRLQHDQPELFNPTPSVGHPFAHNSLLTERSPKRDP